MPLITSPYLSRVIGAKGLGIYSYYYTIVYYFSLFILLGINNHGTREIAKVKEKDKRTLSITFWSIYIIQLFMGIIVFIIYFLSQIYLNFNILSVVFLIYLFSAVIDVNWFFCGLEKFKITVTRNFIVKILTLISIFVFVHSENDVIAYSIIMSLGSLLSQILLWSFLKKEIKYISIKELNIRPNIRPILTLFIPVIAAGIFRYMDKIMLGMMCEKSELGFYDNSEKIMLIPTSMITALGTVMLPRITNLQLHNGQSKIKEYISISLIGSIAIASAMSFGLAAVAPTFAPLFWGKEFVQCGVLIKWISITIVCIAWSNIFRTQYLIPYNKDTIFVKAVVYGAIINFIINFLLIPRYGAMGTVIGTVAAEFVLAFYQTIGCRRELPIKEYVKNTTPYLLFGFLMYLIVSSMNNLNLPAVWLILLEMSTGVLIYTLLIGAYLIIWKKFDYKNWYNIIKSKYKKQKKEKTK